MAKCKRMTARQRAAHVGRATQDGRVVGMGMTARITWNPETYDILGDGHDSAETLDALNNRVLDG